MILRASGPPEIAECRGRLLGVEPEARALDCPLDLAPGDAVVLYTDGISEARVDRPLPAGTIADALQRVLADRAAAIARRAVELVEEHAGARCATRSPCSCCP